MILSCQNISKAFVENQVLKMSLSYRGSRKAAIVGINGAGKTTLLRIIVGEMTPDDGQVVLAKDKTLGYLAQNSTVDTSHTIMRSCYPSRRICCAWRKRSENAKTI